MLEIIGNSGFSVLSLVLILLLALLFSSYIKIVTVLAILRVGIGFGSVPSAFITGGLALVLSLFVMYPTIERTAQAIDSSAPGGVSSDAGRVAAIKTASSEWKKFVLRHTHEKERDRFVELVKQSEHESAEASAESDELATSWRILAPAFFVSELKEAFATGLSLFLPFLLVELLVAHILVAVGIPQLNPHVVSLPFKLLLFVLVDGWGIMTSNLVSTYL